MQVVSSVLVELLIIVVGDQMKKLELNLNELKVNTFATGSSQVHIGTVKGNFEKDTQEERITYTIGPSCGPSCKATCDYSCLVDTCRTADQCCG